MGTRLVAIATAQEDCYIMPVETQRTRTEQLEDRNKKLEKVLANPAADPRKVRRVIAEDPEWNLETVPPLVDLCISHVVNDFSNNPILHELPLPQREKVLSLLPPSVPLNVTGPLIDEEDYWKRCCQERWPLCVVARHGGCWKRMLFEKHVQDLIEKYVPKESDTNKLEDELKLASPYVVKLDVTQLLPPPHKEKVLLLDDEEDRMSDIESIDPAPDHIDFGIALKTLHLLQELHISYGVKNCGMNFEWNLFEFTKEDCLRLAKAVKATAHLKVLRVHRSKMTDDKGRLLISYLLDHPGLLMLDLSHNNLGDGTGRALAKLLNNRCILHTLDISNNKIGEPGGSSLGHTLQNNTSLTTLNMKLNRLGDQGVQALFKALMKNSTLCSLDLGSNDFSEPSAPLLSEMLIANKTLKQLNITCNKLGEMGGKLLQEGVEENKTLTQLDLRLTDISAESEYTINQIVRVNAQT